MLSPYLRSLLEAEGDPEPKAPTDEPAPEEETTPEDTTPEGDTAQPDETDELFAGGPSAEGEEGEEDLTNNPDGLPSPDDMGDDTSTSEEEPDETNIQLNILPLAKIDRLQLKRKCFSNFRDLRTKLDRVKSLLDQNEQLLEAKFREAIEDEVGDLSTAVTFYMTTKFSYNNYEENVKNYTIFANQLKEITQKVLNNDKSESK